VVVNAWPVSQVDALSVEALSAPAQHIFLETKPELLATPPPDALRPYLYGEILSMSDQVTTPHKRHRVEVRMNPQQDALIRQAADLEHTTVTAFVLDSVTARAAQVVRRHQDLVLANEDFDRLIAELDKPATPVAELTTLFDRHPKLPET
jgi:uncharacterized protein (DUF1778 family)